MACHSNHNDGTNSSQQQGGGQGGKMALLMAHGTRPQEPTNAPCQVQYQTAPV